MSEFQLRLEAMKGLPTEEFAINPGINVYASNDLDASSK
jgi:hypothetical protein